MVWKILRNKLGKKATKLKKREKQSKNMGLDLILFCLIVAGNVNLAKTYVSL